MGLQVERDGRQVKVADLVGMSTALLKADEEPAEQDGDQDEDNHDGGGGHGWSLSNDSSDSSEAWDEDEDEVEQSHSLELWKLSELLEGLTMERQPNVGKSSTLNCLLGTHRVAVSCHPGRTKHYQTHFMTGRLVLCDCPGLVFPRLDVSLPMQVLFGSYPIANCRDLYAVVDYLAAATLAIKRHWQLPRSGRLDTYRAANWLLRAALAGRQGLGLAFLPPAENC
eukprot:gene10086-10241_t